MLTAKVTRCDVEKLIFHRAKPTYKTIFDIFITHRGVNTKTLPVAMARRENPYTREGHRQSSEKRPRWMQPTATSGSSETPPLSQNFSGRVTASLASDDFSHVLPEESHPQLGAGNAGKAPDAKVGSTPSTENYGMFVLLCGAATDS